MYRVVSFRLWVFLLGPVVAIAMLVAVGVTNDFGDLEVGALIALFSSAAGFGLGGIAGLVIGLKKRREFARMIIAQNGTIRVVSEDPSLRNDLAVMRFARHILASNIVFRINSRMNNYLKVQGAVNRVDWDALPPLVLWLQRGAVKHEWRGFVRWVSGMQDGAVLYAQIKPTWKKTGGLVVHEVGHGICSLGLGMHGMESRQHALLSDSGVTGSDFLEGYFSEGGIDHGAVYDLETGEEVVNEGESIY